MARVSVFLIVIRKKSRRSRIYQQRNAGTVTRARWRAVQLRHSRWREIIEIEIVEMIVITCLDYTCIIICEARQFQKNAMCTFLSFYFFSHKFTSSLHFEECGGEAHVGAHDELTVAGWKFLTYCLTLISILPVTTHHHHYNHSSSDFLYHFCTCCHANKWIIYSQLYGVSEISVSLLPFTTLLNQKIF